MDKNYTQEQKISNEEGKKMLGVGYFVARYFAVDDAGEDAGHSIADCGFRISAGYCLIRPSCFSQIKMLRILKAISPAGVVICAVSPTFLPKSPLPIGELADIFLSFRLASDSETSL